MRWQGHSRPKFTPEATGSHAWCRTPVLVSNNEERRSKRVTSLRAGQRELATSEDSRPVLDTPLPGQLACRTCQRVVSGRARRIGVFLPSRTRGPGRLGSSLALALRLRLDDNTCAAHNGTAHNGAAHNGEEHVPAPLWTHRPMRYKVTACVLHDGHLYGFNESMLRCADLDGGGSWRVRGLGLGSLSVACMRLLVLTSDAEHRRRLSSAACWGRPRLPTGRLRRRG